MTLINLSDMIDQSCVKGNKATKIKGYCLILFIFLILCCHGQSMADYKQASNQIVGKIIKNIPGSWKFIKTEPEALPHGHYWGLDYEGPKGLLLVIEGDKDVFLHWKDKNGNWQKEALAKESLELWIMPPEYSESWKRFFVFHRPKSAELLFFDKKVRVFCYPNHRIVSGDRFNNVLSNAKSTKWPDSPANRGILSWGTWKEDLIKIIE